MAATGLSKGVKVVKVPSATKVKKAASSAAASVKAPRAKKVVTSKVTRTTARKPATKKVVNESSLASAVGPDARTLVDWLKTDDKRLLAGIEAQLDVYELSMILHREPTSILRHMDEVGLFEFTMHSEEQVEIFDLAFSGVPLQVAILWCEGDDQRLLWSQIKAMRKLPSQRTALEFAREQRMWNVTPATVEALAWSLSQPVDKINESILAIQARFDALTPQCLKDQINGVVPVRHAPSFGSWAAKSGDSGFSAITPASTKAAALAQSGGYASSHSGKKASGGYKKSRYGKSSTSTGGGYKKGRYGKRRTSTSVPSGAPCADTRTVAEKAWENRTHW